MLLCLGLFAKAGDKSAIVYYGTDISYANVGLHDYIIVEADNISPYTHGFKTYKKNIYAYVSIGEAIESRGYFKDLKDEWKIAHNTAWKSTVMDVSNDDYHTFVYDNIIQPLIDKGYENFFFDTLDSYTLSLKGEESTDKYRRGLIRFIKKFKLRFPKSKLVLNRGFEIIDEVHESIDAVLFESLFYGLSAKSLAYTKVDPKDRQWLLSKVEKLRPYQLDLIAVEYVDIKDKEKIHEVIEKSKALGIIPYVANKAFTRYGDSSKVAYKREILVLYNSKIKKELSSAHHLASLPLEYLGYIPVLKRIEKGLPDINELTRYKAVLIWPEKPIENTEAYEAWFRVLTQEKIPFLFVEGFGLNDDTVLASYLGVKKVQNKADVLDKQEIVSKDKIFDFETPLRLNYAPTLYQATKATKLLVLTNTYGQENVPVALMPWGGYALSGIATANFSDNTLWVINPYEFFKMGLKLESIPVPDPTTQTGRRLLFTHIDGDASMNKAQWDPRAFSIGVMYDKILSKYKIPQSVSIVQAETDPHGLYPQDSLALETQAQKIYSLPYVEGATHTLTHPFKWGEIKNDELNESYRLKLPGYKFSLDKEISGSLDYINTRLMPAGKKQANTLYWTGDCLPTESTLEYAYKHNILNINGGDTIITNDKPWLSLVAPYGIKRGEYRQVYTGAENENVYTNDWLGPFWGYKKVIQTFELTNKPRRLKPIDIYYHFYAASKIASLRALDEVYQWALVQETMPIYTSEFIPKVLEFYDISMYKTEKQWHCKGMKELKTLRLDESLDMVDYKTSVGILGEKRDKSQRYVHVDTRSGVKLSLSKDANKDVNYIIDTNAEVLNDTMTKDGRTFSLNSYVDIVLNYHLKKGCRLETSPKPKSQQTSGNDISLKFKGREANVIIKCK